MPQSVSKIHFFCAEVMDAKANSKPEVGDTVEYEKPHHGVVQKVTPSGNLLVKDFESNHALLLEPKQVKKIHSSYTYDRRTP